MDGHYSVFLPDMLRERVVVNQWMDGWMWYLPTDTRKTLRCVRVWSL